MSDFVIPIGWLRRPIDAAQPFDRESHTTNPLRSQFIYIKTAQKLSLH
jgi:hypothetical protein